MKVGHFILGAWASLTLAIAAPRSDLSNSVATYKPMAGFNHIVDESRFIGYFLAGPKRCDVTIFQARADDEGLIAPPNRMVLQIAAGGRSEIDAGHDAALAIACTLDADAIKVAPQFGKLRAAAH